jgi:hypothetical protein
VLELDSTVEFEIDKNERTGRLQATSVRLV